ncbi:hypothetical protein QQ045_032035 [Rhodiola kirilowii]
MPLERVVVRNEYGLGMPELYKGVTEDPKAVFDGVAVAGLVGLLRQLGDLAEFAAEVFHGLQEEVMTTSCRSRKLVIRVKQIESALPAIEKVALAQKSHIHFCYTAGTDWHVHLQNKHNHFIHGELPKIIMDSYEECREPPRLHLLDKFDSNGPGSCLKKYSDPTFFRKASPISDEAADKAEKDKKRSRRKKKRQGQKNREVQNLLISEGIARMQLVPPTVHESPAHCISDDKTSFESGVEGRSRSFELRAGLDYIECVFDHKPTMEAEEEEPKEPQSSQYTLQPYENFHSNYSDSHDKTEDDEYRHKSSLQYEASSSSTRVSWEEKTEIVNYKDYECLPDEAIETPKNDILETAATNLHHADQTHFTSDVVSTEHLTSLPEDIESDVEDFMDALNTIESETEFESDCQAKQEVEHSVLEANIPEIAHQSSHEPTSLNSLNGLTSPCKPSSDCLEATLLNGFTHEKLPQLAVKCNTDDLSIILEGSHSNGTNSDPLPNTIPESQDSRNLLSDKLMSGLHDTHPHESSSGSSEKSSVTFWTNGGLLGLQPSKPPDFKASAGANKNCKEDECNSAVKDQIAASRSDELTGNVHQELNNAPPMSGLAYRLFSNGFQRKIPSLHDYRSLPIGSPENDSVERNTVAPKSFRERFANKLFTTAFDVNSPSSSPPLEHMKISFLPMDALEASHLKLKFHDEDINHELYGNMLPSFQLVPDTSVHPRENGTDSDGDTFCRSPQSGSDDNLDYHSESSSGRWESSETPKSNEQHKLYDDLCSMPSAESISGYRDLDNSSHEYYHPDQANTNSRFIENEDKPFSNRSNELPSFDVIKSSVPHKRKSCADLKEPLAAFQFPDEATPLPPPLPPSQWISSKLRSDVTSDQPDVPSEGLGHAHGVQVTGFASLEQQNLLSTWQPKILEVPTSQHKVHESTMLPNTYKLQDQQKVFGKAKVNQAGNEYDDKDDFLQQIRAQSFNLRRTSLISSTRSNSMPTAPITNAKVTAILEKANAIRQVIASDDGEDDDDTWSE